MKPAADISFSPSDAALEGFQVLRRHWRVVVGWAGFNLLAMVAMVAVAVVLIVLGVALVGSGSREAAGGVGAVIGGLVGFLGALAIEVCVVTAIYRLLLNEGEPGFFYLHWGRDELRLLAVWACLIALAGAAAFAVVGLAAASAKVAPWAPWLVSLAGAALGIWLMIRLSLAAPATFAGKRLGLADAWRMSRGRFWSLLGMNALLFCLLAMVSVAAWLVMFLVAAGFTGFHDWGAISLSDRDALTEHPGRYLLQLVAELAFAPVLLVISQAPLAAAYQAFTRTLGLWDRPPNP